MNEPSSPNKSITPVTSGKIYEGGRRKNGDFKEGHPLLPLVSYVTVVLNGEKSIERTLDSVQSQTYKNIEHIVIDGASTDKTLSILKSREHQIDYLLSEKDFGLYDALNKAIALCRGDLICVLNADDWLLEAAAETAANAHLQTTNPAHLILTSAEVILRGKKHIWHPARLNAGAYFQCANICHNGVYASREMYRASGGYDSSYKIAGDFKWLMRCCDIQPEVINLNEVTVHYSLGGLSSDTKSHSSECVRLIVEKFPFLTMEEAWGIFHTLNVFEDNKIPFMDLAPKNYTQFVSEIALRHHNERDFIQALGLASLPHIRHFKDFQWAKIKPTRVQKLKNSIRKRIPSFGKK
jgi:glycosyltransferase involved in cell wall biosynthesis